MSVTIVQTPAYPTADRPVRVAFSLTGGGNFVRVWATDAPIGSELRKKLDAAGASRVEVFAGDAADVWTFRADRGGCYVFAAQEYQRGAASGFSGGYAGDARGVPSETKIGAESSITVRFGQRLTMPLGAGADTATLVLWAWGDTIRATTTELHGEASPAIVGPSTAKARIASAHADVRAALAALADTTATTALGAGGLAAVLCDLIATVGAHLADTDAHHARDAANAIPGDYVNDTYSARALPGAVGAVLSALSRHVRTDDGTGTGSGGWHVIDGVTRGDLDNVPIAPLPGDIAGCTVALADAWRCYEAHRVSTAVHSAADTTNALAALSPLLDLHRAFLVALRSAAPATVNAAVATLVQSAGMREG